MIHVGAMTDTGQAINTHDGGGYRVLIVEDEIIQQRLLGSLASKAGYAVDIAASGAEALDRLLDQDADGYGVIILDQMMPGMSGLDVLKTIRKQGVLTPVIMLTSQAAISTVVDAMRAGATDFIVKPASAERLRTALKAAIDGSSLAGDVVEDLARPSIMNKSKATIGADGFDSLVGRSTALMTMTHLGKKVAKTGIPVLIEGESGVGKEVFARAIHAESTRGTGRFVAVNCGAIPENLVESILFGHEKGAFTGATEKKTGVFKQADGGTLFLDEVGELPLDVQVKLLRALQEREITPVGSKQSFKVDIRVVSATNRSLMGEIESGNFREDLYYRLNVFPITLPPLRDRLEDIPLLAGALLERLAKAEGMPQKKLSNAAQSQLMRYAWPGNVRQLQNALFRAVVLSESDTLEPRDFPLGGAVGQAPRHPVADARLDQFGAQVDQPGGDELAQGRPAISFGKTVPLTNIDQHIRPLAALERDIIAAALERYDGRMTEVARRLDIGRSTLYRKVADYGLDVPTKG